MTLLEMLSLLGTVTQPTPASTGYFLVRVLTGTMVLDALAWATMYRVEPDLPNCVLNFMLA